MDIRSLLVRSMLKLMGFIISLMGKIKSLNIHMRVLEAQVAQTVTMAKTPP